MIQQARKSLGQTLGDPIPLELPTSRWGLTSVDFIVKLPKAAAGFDYSASWTDRLSHRVHFLPLQSTEDAVAHARL